MKTRLLFILLFISSISFSQVYVNKSATGANNGTSWSDAYTNLQTALSNVAAGNEIWIAKGTYKPHASSRSSSFSITKNDVKIYGGFAGTEATLTDRDISLLHTTNKTILSGDLAGNDTSTFRYFVRDGARTDNSYIVVKVRASNITIDGVTVSDGYNNSSRYASASGISIDANKQNFTLKNSVIKDNAAAVAGAGIYYRYNLAATSSLILDACIFENNISQLSAGIFITNQNNNTTSILNVQITNSLFNKNRTGAPNDNKARGGAAGYVYGAYGNTNVSIVNNTFVNNKNDGLGSGSNFPTFGLTKGVNGNITTNIANNIFWGNTRNGSRTRAFGRLYSNQGPFPTVTVYNSIDNDNFSNISNKVNTSNTNPNLIAGFKLNTGSSAKDAGLNSAIPNGITTDLSGDSRIYNTTVDIGAYEFSPCTTFVNIPDTNFKNALLAINGLDIDGDGEICTAEASAYTSALNVSNKNISDLTGIEAFTNITGLYCYNNQLTSLDVSANTALTQLICRNNQLTSLDASSNASLTQLYCNDNQLTSLDVSLNTSLVELGCNDNQLTSLDVSGATALTNLYCHDNQLTSLNLANGNNGTTGSNLYNVNATNNPNLTCIQHDSGFDPTTTTNWRKDTTASWSDNCTASSCTSIVNIPDANFKNALLAHGASAPVNGVNPITGTGISVIDTDGDGKICTTEAQAYTGVINVYNQNISDLTGIEAFTKLTDLRASSNRLTSIDISRNVDLINLDCGFNPLTSIDVSRNVNLEYLFCYFSQLTSIDVSANSALKTLLVNNNQIESLDLSGNTALNVLRCQINNLTSLNVANGNNGTGSSNLYRVDVTDNTNLTCIQHDAGFDPTTVTSWKKDATANWSTNCGPDTVAPTVATQNITVQLDASGNATITPQQVNNGSSDNRDAVSSLIFALSKTTFDCSNVGVNTVTLTVTDTSNNSANATAVVTIQDATQPNIVAQNITVQLDANGNATITPQQIDNGSSDNCSIASMSLNKTTFDCSNVGANQVVLTIVDANNNTSTATATVTVEDSIAPIAVAQNLSVQLGTNGQVSVTPAQINNGSSDNCTSAANLTYSLSKINFTCNDVGANNITLTVTDTSGNQGTAIAVVMVSQNPNAQLEAVTQNITVQLDANGQATITPQQIDNGSGSGCNSNPTLSLDKTTFDCSNVGTNTVTLTATDNGNSVSATAIVTVQDATQPTIIAQDITVQLDASGNATITPQQVDNGSSDNCSIASMSLDTTSFTCANTGANQVVLTLVDANGNSNTATATVTVEDSIAPTVMVQNISVQLGANNQVMITPSQINNGSSDNCTSATNLTYSLDTTTFSCSEVGANNVVLTVTDASGNSATATAVVAVTTNPNAPLVAVAQNITVQLDANGSVTIQPSDVDNGSGSGCNSNPTLSLDKTTFDCSNIGANTVTLTVTDGVVTETATAIVTVEDTMMPTVITKDITVTLNNGQASIAVSDIDDNSTDNCSIASTSLDKTNFTCSDLGANTVNLTVTDSQGNVATKTAVVTVVETDAPTVITRNITVALDANGLATITPQQVDNGSNDGCSGIASITLDKTSFQCPTLGTVTVILTVTDKSGNKATKPATVTFTAPDEDNDGISDACDSKEILLSKGFSPNNDGTNDTWVIENIDNYPNHKVEVFGRSGARVLNATNYQNDWDATVKGNSEKVPVGSYYYVIDLGDGSKPIQGWMYINY